MSGENGFSPLTYVGNWQQCLHPSPPLLRRADLPARRPEGELVVGELPSHARRLTSQAKSLSGRLPFTPSLPQACLPASLALPPICT